MQTVDTTLPFPPRELMYRVGAFPGSDTPAGYEAFGALLKQEVLGLLPDGWSFEGKRVLDFGCGAGRVLRHFHEESRTATIAGCDIDRASVDWIRANLNWIDARLVEEPPPAPWPDSSFDLIWALSVFTHLTDHWAGWLLELHRLLQPDGVLIATFLGPAMSMEIAGESWEEDRIGINVLRYGESWDRGGPVALYSPWWIRAHWGRAFDIVELHPTGFPSPDDRSLGHGVVVAKPRAVHVTPADLTRPADDPRELQASRHNVTQLLRDQRGSGSSSSRQVATPRPSSREHDAAVAAAEERVAQMYEATVSWRLTSPLRAVRRRLS